MTCCFVPPPLETSRTPPPDPGIVAEQILALPIADKISALLDVNQHRQVRLVLVENLCGEHGPVRPEAYDAFVALAEDPRADSTLRLFAIGGLKNLGRCAAPAVDVLGALLTQEDPALADAATSALGAIGGPRALIFLLDASRSALTPAMPSNLGAAVAEISLEDGVPLLCTAALRSHPDAIFAAHELTKLPNVDTPVNISESLIGIAVDAPLLRSRILAAKSLVHRGRVGLLVTALLGALEHPVAPQSLRWWDRILSWISRRGTQEETDPHILALRVLMAIAPDLSPQQQGQVAAVAKNLSDVDDRRISAAAAECVSQLLPNVPQQLANHA